MVFTNSFFEERGLTLQDALEEVEKKCWLLRAYRQCKTTYEMAETLGLSQATVVRRLKKSTILIQNESINSKSN
ncbi:hypothetical protein GCM10020331_055870 [Ectobacillus funiculus]